MSADDEGDEAVAYTMYEWDCPRCQEVNKAESDPAGETLECEACGCMVLIRETR